MKFEDNFKIYSKVFNTFTFLVAGEMVIEYAGELIRSTLTDKRERYYDGRGIGCYMFKIDDNFVVDATMRGNAARFINHSCDVSSVFILFCARLFLTLPKFCRVAKLLLKGCRYSGTQTHHHLRITTNNTGRRVNVRL